MQATAAPTVEQSRYNTIGEHVGLRTQIENALGFRRLERVQNPSISDGYKNIKKRTRGFLGSLFGKKKRG